MKPIYRLTTCGLMAALLCALSPMALPIGPIPITLATLVIYLAVYIQGMKDATVSVLVYLLLGCMGLPVFSGYSGGVARLVGPTGGYLVGYILLALVSGFVMEKCQRKLLPTVLAMILGTAVLYIFGTGWFLILTGKTLVYALGVCVVPFLPGDLAKIIVAAILGKLIRSALVRAKLLV